MSDDGRAILERLRADLGPLETRFSLVLIGAGHSAPAGHGGGVLPFGGIDISAQDTVYGMLVNVPDPADANALHQLLHLLDQVQDHIIETEGAAWPRCPEHEHPLTLSAGEGRIAWKCSETGRLIASFGELGASPR